MPFVTTMLTIPYQIGSNSLAHFTLDGNTVIFADNNISGSTYYVYKYNMVTKTLTTLGALPTNNQIACLAISDVRYRFCKWWIYYNTAKSRRNKRFNNTTKHAKFRYCQTKQNR